MSDDGKLVVEQLSHSVIILTHSSLQTELPTLRLQGRELHEDPDPYTEDELLTFLMETDLLHINTPPENSAYMQDMSHWECQVVELRFFSGYHMYRVQSCGQVHCVLRF